MNSKCKGSTRFVIGLLVLLAATAMASATALAQADVAIGTFRSPSPVKTSVPFSYVLSIGASGTATGVVLTVNLPAGVTFVSASAKKGSTTVGSCSEAGGVVTCNNLPSPGGATSTMISVTITVIPQDSLLPTPTSTVTITATAHVSANEPDPNLSNNNVSWTTTVFNYSDVAISTFKSPSAVKTEVPFTYTLSISGGGQAATGVVLTVNLPAGVTFVSASAKRSSTTVGSCSEAGGVVTCNNLPSPGGATSTMISVTITVIPQDSLLPTPTSTVTITATAHVSANEPDPNLSNNNVSRTTTVYNYSDVAISTFHSPSPGVTTGVSFPYVLSIFASGQPATGVMLTVNLPAEVTFVSASAKRSSTTVGSCSEAGGVVTCSNLPSPGGATSTAISVTITVIATGESCSLTSTAYVSANEPDPNLSNNSATRITTVFPPCGDTTPPAVNLSFAPNGSNSWFASSPAIGTVTAIDAFPSNITAINCTGASVSNLTGIGSSSASGTVSVSGSGIHDVTCTASDSAGNSGAAPGSLNIAVVRIDVAGPIASDLTPAPCSLINYNQPEISVIVTDEVSGIDATSVVHQVDGQIVTHEFIVLATGAGGIVTQAKIAHFPSQPLDDGEHAVDVYVTDNAGNPADLVVTCVNIDTVPPQVTESPPLQNTSSVTFQVSGAFETYGYSGNFPAGTCSGETCTLPDLPDGTYTITVTVTDEAGNVAIISWTFTIDTTPPSITGSRTPLANANGWNNTEVTVHFDCVDGLSGVAFVTPDSVLSAEGAGQFVEGSCTDLAGNSASALVGDINIDKTAPLITGSRTPLANANGWNNTDVTVHFDCTDALAGVDSLTPDTLLSDEGAAQEATGTCVDLAGNSASALVGDINIDKTAPLITGLRTPTANANAWNNTDVTVSFECTDALAGIAGTPGETTLSGEGAGQFVTATCTDLAGNGAEATVTDINIDKTAPEIAIISPADGATFSLNEVVAASYACSDALAGAASCAGPVADGANIDTGTPGLHNFAVEAADLAGNTTTLIHSYEVQATLYFLVLLPPSLPDVAKAGSTIPIRWQYVDQAGNVVDSASANPQVLINAGNCSSDAEAPLIEGDDSGQSGLRYDTDSKTWAHNLKTQKGTSASLNIWIKTLDTGQMDYVGCVAIKP